MNFGMLTGREATPTELDELSARLLPLLGEVTVVAEHRQDTDGVSELELHQVRIDLPADAPVDGIVEVAEGWAQECFADRHAEVSEP